ncbi:DUF1624 domain-containing protein [Thalassotalea sediminis]|uniref:DUF1624 domain-containing protein n=1 Tax=Thalassotalea sediminis TaxID=1759089 RepID=UPI0025725CE4|nr:heparan-alpha-glucosaminide N-acetyltransferase domain-containing protein [Thalassotalea sediminis]
MTSNTHIDSPYQESLKSTPNAIKKRLVSIDILRGLVMLLMLVDHVRERFFYHHNVADPMILDETDTSLFFTRISAHFCAPVFVFLTGLSAWLYAHPSNGNQRSAQSFLLKRGLFIIFVEITLINFSWFGDYNALYLQVMWAIGLSMVALAIVTKLPHWLIGCLGFIIVFGHNALAFIHFQPNELGYTLWTILHDRGFIFTGESFKVKASYPVLPWIGVILLGYFIAPIFSSHINAQKRTSTLILCGISCILLLLVLRGFNIYGETLPWVSGVNWLESLKSFINYTKYPPSLDFLLFTLGIALLLLATLEQANNSITNAIAYFGGAPMFFYILHLYVLLVSYRVLVSMFGTNKGEYWGVDSIWQIWCIAAFLAILLYWPTKKFGVFKRKSNAAWTKYL